MRLNGNRNQIAPSRTRWHLVVIAFGLIGSIAACASSTGGAIPVETFVDEAAPAGGGYVIEPGDALNVQVFEQEKMSGRVKVRTDGRISLPLLNDVLAAGKTPATLAAELEGSLKALILTPRVTVAVEESSPLRISVLGEVATQGPKDLPRGSGVAQALAAAGGLTTFADANRIFVVRVNPKPVRIHFTFDAVTRGIGRAAAFQLRPGDVVVVE